MAMTQGPDGTPAFEELRDRLRARRRDFESAAAARRPVVPDDAFVLKPFVPAPRTPKVERSRLSTGLVLTALAVAATAGWIGYYALQSVRESAPAEVAILSEPATAPSEAVRPPAESMAEAARDGRLRPSETVLADEAALAARQADEAQRAETERLAREGTLDGGMATGTIPLVRDVTPRFGASTTTTGPATPAPAPAPAAETVLQEDLPDETTAVPDETALPDETAAVPEETPALPMPDDVSPGAGDPVGETAALPADAPDLPDADPAVPENATDGTSAALDPGPAVEAPVEGADPASAPGSIVSAVNMRASPENGAPVVSVLRDGATVEVIACDLWCEVVADGKRGFVFKSFIAGRG